MFIIIWQYTINPQHLKSFTEYYHSSGNWVKFFQQSPYYFETEFFSGENENQFLTIDKWMDEKTYEQFLTENKKEYQKIDKLCEGFTVEESLIGKYLKIEI
jgi:hypothetical protein